MIDPPKLINRFFSWFCHRNHLEGLEGDLYELFDRNVEKYGAFKAKFLYVQDVLTLMRRTVARPLIRSNSKLNNMDIYKNYLLTALRMGWKRKGFSFINIIGLVLGVTSVIFIALFINDEILYDEHISQHSNKYRIYNIYHSSSGATKKLAIVPPMYAPEFKANFSQVIKAGRLMLDYGGSMFRIGEQIFAEDNGYFAETEALDILDFKLLHGSLSGLDEANSMLVSESTYERFFGEEPFGNQTVMIGEKTTISVVGVYEDVPRQSHLKPDYIISFNYLRRQVSEERINSWVWQQFYTYIELADATDPMVFDLMSEYIEQTAWPVTAEYNMHYEPQFQRVTDVHLHSANMEWDEADRGNYQAVVFLSLAAAIILFIACLNFINLTTAQAVKRSQEVVVRKFIGARRSQLIVQYVIESLVYTLISGVISVGLVFMLLPVFNELVDKSFSYSDLLQIRFVLVFVVGLLVLGVVSGIYPAMLITSFKPLNVLHGISRLQKAGLKLDLRQLMVGAQYVLTCGLVLISLIMQKQYDHLQNSDMGFDKENLLVIPITRAMRNDISQTINRFAGHYNVLDITACFGVPGGIVAGDNVDVPDLNNEAQSVSAFMVDENYIPVLDLELIAGRNFKKNSKSDEFGAFIINETAVKSFGFGSPQEALGKRLNWEMWDDGDTLKRGEVIGVIRDFNYKSLHNAVENVVLQIDRTEFQSLVLKVGSGNLQETIGYLEEQYRTMEPNRLFEFEFVDQSFQEFYASENRLSRLFTAFTFLAIFTAAIGLFGLVSYSVVSRGKEIGIRKVLGAGELSIFGLLIRRYMILVGVSLLIALPLAAYLSSMWLDNFAYRIAITPGVFLLVIILTLLLTLLTVGFQAMKGAMANPADKLRTE
ncbi:FtsX-like permease family protein [Marinoscillum sp.]|uniref:FtsX-like permease family protein n=1 Tax=Marinoscillum sp. TaxID=2024838 RepID=UPI003BACE247